MYKLHSVSGGNLRARLEVQNPLPKLASYLPLRWLGGAKFEDEKRKVVQVNRPMLPVGRILLGIIEDVELNGRSLSRMVLVIS